MLLYKTHVNNLFIINDDIKNFIKIKLIFRSDNVVF